MKCAPAGVVATPGLDGRFALRHKLAMKSAYELAMERLNQSDPEAGRPLTTAKKKALQEIEQRYAAKVAEKRVFLGGQIEKARREGDAESLRQLEAQLKEECIRLGEEKEQARQAIRGSA